MLRVLTYHRVADAEGTPELDPALISATPEVFRRQMKHLRRWYAPVTLADVLSAYRTGRRLPRHAVHVTFDDAYRDFAEQAWPILREMEIPATLFVPTAYPEQGARAFWWDRLHRAAQRIDVGSAGAQSQLAEAIRRGHFKALRARLRQMPHDELEALVDGMSGDEEGASAHRDHVLSWDALRTLHRDGVSLGVHTRHHVALTRVPEMRARIEIRGSIEDLRREVGGAPPVLAYPYGIYNERIAQIAREEGCLLAFSCDVGLNQPRITDPMRLKRTNITPRTSPAVFSIRMLPWFAPIDRWRRSLKRSEAHA
jgi:peptidoglycan/xylan/chitin deacetylase (PgdA/CDA1 family)